METVILDVSDCKYVGELHQKIKEVFSFPDYYGENWDAFYDMMCMESRAEKIIIRGIADANNMIKSAVEEMIDTLQAVQVHHKRFHKTLRYEMED